jgi:hypothetical protein
VIVPAVIVGRYRRRGPFVAPLPSHIAPPFGGWLWHLGGLGQVAVAVIGPVPHATLDVTSLSIAEGAGTCARRGELINRRHQSAGLILRPRRNLRAAPGTETTSQPVMHSGRS